MENQVLQSLIVEKKYKKKNYIERKKKIKALSLIGILAIFAKLRMILNGADYLLLDNFLVNIITLVPEFLVIVLYVANDRCNIMIDRLDKEVENLEEQLEQGKLRDIKIKVMELSKSNELELSSTIKDAEFIKLVMDIEDNKILNTIRDFDEKTIEEKINYFKDNDVNELISISNSYKKERK